MRNPTVSLMPLLVLTMVSPAELAAQAAPPDSVEAVLTLSEGDSLLVLDSLVRHGDRLEVRSNSVGRARFVIGARLTPEAAVAEARVRVWPEGRESPQVDMSVALEDGTLTFGTTGAAEREERSVPENTLIYVPPAVSFVEQAARRARALRAVGDSASFTLWSPYRGGRTLTAVARFPHPGTVTLSFDDATYTLAVDSAGNLLGGRLEPSGHTIERE